MSALTLESVSVSRGAGPVISDVTLTVESGSVTALVGPNGAGKTSLLESISGVIGTSAGSINLDGKPIGKLSRVRRARAGIVHIEQGRAVFPSLTVLENLRLTARSQREVDEAIALFPELEKRIASATGLLSGGEQQMVVLARAFASKPRFLLIDEMSLGLAPVVFMRLLPIVDRLRENGVGVLLVEQFTHLALSIARDALVVASGRVTYQGPAAELQNSPEILRHAYLGTPPPPRETA
ncbi:ABC transporter ATP-binding protein [Luethyella okanaganae]|uniref:ABC transporter ATP-binding protein n=1 Tax=Luethyella okanaganae TaxID=69372 RepID=A0ABW1VBB5_9MICO